MQAENQEIRLDILNEVLYPRKSRERLSLSNSLLLPKMARAMQITDIKCKQTFQNKFLKRHSNRGGYYLESMISYANNQGFAAKLTLAEMVMYAEYLKAVTVWNSNIHSLEDSKIVSNFNIIANKFLLENIKWQQVIESNCEGNYIMFAAYFLDILVIADDFFLKDKEVRYTFVLPKNISNAEELAKLLQEQEICFNLINPTLWV